MSPTNNNNNTIIIIYSNKDEQTTITNLQNVTIYSIKKQTSGGEREREECNSNYNIKVESQTSR